MAVTKEEKLLSSIDGTLKDILKELKHQGRERSTQSISIDSSKFSESDLEVLKRTRILVLDSVEPGDISTVLKLDGKEIAKEVREINRREDTIRANGR
ncbi:hypothetical protein [Planococcus koreensis]|uniref:hypothetical protein n=1 Tax=Planococcus koreensis TaxID=112331 RepID=UPI0039FBFC16